MSDEHAELLRQLAHDVLHDVGEALTDPDERQAATLWGQLVELGWPLVGIPEEDGGSGGTFDDLLTLLEAVGFHGAPVPLAEAAAAADVTVSRGLGEMRPDRTLALSDAAALRWAADSNAVSGILHRVPWARTASELVVATPDGRIATVALDGPGVTVTRGVNVAGEPRDGVALQDAGTLAASEDDGSTWEQLRSRAVLARAAMSVGAIDRVLALTRTHVLQREQFGRPLVRFQLVSSHLATMAVEQRNARVSLVAARDAVASDVAVAEHVAAARVTVARSSDTISRLAHQLHGAIGTTREHALHRFTTRLWAWRDEWLSERGGAAQVGQRVLEPSQGPLWPRLTGWS